MPRTGRPKAELVLSDDEREQLLRWSRRAKSSQALALRTRIVLACAQGASNEQVAEDLGVTRRPSASGVGGSSSIDWTAWPTSHGGRPADRRDQVEQVLVATLESKPANATHWSRASMAKKSGLSKSTIGRIWSDFELKPHLTDTFKISTDPQFVDKVVDVVGLYHNPPENAVVFCVDEKSQIQALDRSAPVLPMMPGMPERRTHDYARNGVTSLFAAFNIADGTVISEIRTAATGPWSTRSSWPRSTRPCPTGWTCTSSATTCPPTRLRRSRRGWPAIPGSTCTSPRPAALDQPGRALVLLPDHPVAPARRLQERPGPGTGHQSLDQAVERQTPGRSSGRRRPRRSSPDSPNI